MGQRTNVRGKADGEANLEVGKSIAGQQGLFDQALAKHRPVLRHGPPAPLWLELELDNIRVVEGRWRGLPTRFALLFMFL